MITKIEYTPAPWKTGEASWNEDGDVRYTLHGIKEAKASDCILIECAPELLEALSILLADCDSMILEGKISQLAYARERARKVINKSRGE